MRRILAVVLVLNLAVAAAKLAVGWMIDSISMLADGFHSLTDSASNVVGLVGISLAARPPDEDHPYGHRKLETLSALFIGGLLAMTAWEVLQSCFERLRTGSVPEVTAASFAVMGVTYTPRCGSDRLPGLESSRSSTTRWDMSTRCTAECSRPSASMRGSGPSP